MPLYYMSFLVFLWEFQSALTFTLRSWIQFELVSVQKGEERGGGGESCFILLPVHFQHHFLAKLCFSCGMFWAYL